jgi:hypothetical protein
VLKKVLYTNSVYDGIKTGVRMMYRKVLVNRGMRLIVDDLFTYKISTKSEREGHTRQHLECHPGHIK